MSDFRARAIADLIFTTVSSEGLRLTPLEKIEQLLYWAERYGMLSEKFPPFPPALRSRNEVWRAQYENNPGDSLRSHSFNG